MGALANAKSGLDSFHFKANKIMKGGSLPTKGAEFLGGKSDSLLRKGVLANVDKFNQAIKSSHQSRMRMFAQQGNEARRAISRSAVHTARDQAKALTTFNDRIGQAQALASRGFFRRLFGMSPAEQLAKAGAKGGKGSLNAAGLRYQNLGRFAQSLFIKGLGGGIVGGLVGVLGFSAVQGIMGGIGSAWRTLGGFVADSIQEGMDFTRLETSLKFLAQSQPRAESWLNQMIELSSASGFGIKQIGTAFQIMAGQTTDLRQVPSIMRAITEISAGLGADAEKMQRFALAVGQVAAAGRFEGQEILQLTEVLPIKHFAETAGISIGEFRNRMREGTLSVDILWQTLNRLALSPGGAFFGRLAEQGKTAVGQVMQVQQQWTLFKAQVGKGVLEELKDQGVLAAMQQGLAFLLTNKDEVRNFIAEAVDLMKQLAIGTVRWAGAIYDAVNFLRRNRWIFDLLTPGSMLTVDIIRDVGTGELGIGGTGQRWAKEFADAFKSEFVPRVQQAMDLIKFSPKLSADAQKVADSIIERMREGSPLDQFNKQLKMIKEAQDFLPSDRARQIKEFTDESNRLVKESKRLFEAGRRDEANRLFGQAENLAEQAKNVEALPPFGAAEADFGRAEAFLKLEESLTKMANELPQALKAGSVEAQSTINKALMGDKQATIQERISRTLDIHKKQNDARERLLKEIAQKLSPRPTVFGMRIPGA